ncbi:MAG UNVERIFIED_CONTAM: hypothetical protein LVQ98_00255 [Rickettsiaceae bacterium]|jgi:hypothetical protein
MSQAKYLVAIQNTDKKFIIYRYGERIVVAPNNEEIPIIFAIPVVIKYILEPKFLNQKPDLFLPMIVAVRVISSLLSPEERGLAKLPKYYIT